MGNLTRLRTRLDYSDGGCPSLLLEPASTNLLPYSTLAFNGGASPTGYSIGFGTGTFSHEELTYKGQGAVKQTQITLGRSYLDTGTLTLIANTEYNLCLKKTKKKSELLRVRNLSLK